VVANVLGIDQLAGVGTDGHGFNPRCAYQRCNGSAAHGPHLLRGALLRERLEKLGAVHRDAALLLYRF
jgi:hypothetical protein